MFNLKKAAVFGIDARIGLVLISIASLAVALNKQSLIESSRIQEISLRLSETEDAIMQDYKDNYKSANFITKGYDSMTSDEKLAMWQGKTELMQDPWGNQWKVKAFVSTSTTLTAYGEKIEPVCIVIYSAGADGYHHLETSSTMANYDDCINNVGLTYTASQTEISDDYFYKFTTISYEIDINNDVKDRLAKIKQALYEYSEAKKNVRYNYCQSLTQTAADADALCDVNSSGTYDVTELENVNYMPKSSTDATAAVYASATTYDATIITQLQALLTELGLPTSYATDLIGRQLRYDSNTNSSTTGPYIASFYYKVI